MIISVVLTDANILFSRPLRDCALCTVDEGAIEVHWSQEILTEMSQAATRRDAARLNAAKVRK